MMDEFEKKAVVVALKKMFKGSNFSICTVDSCLKITGAKPSEREYDALHVLHCVNWSEMDKDLMKETMLRTVNMIMGEALDLSLLDAYLISHGMFDPPPPNKKGLFSWKN